MRFYLFITLCAVFLVSSDAIAQSHRHDGKTTTRTHQSLPVTAIVRAKIDPAAMSISGLVEISLRNNSEHDMSEAYIYLPLSDNDPDNLMLCRIDSLLFNGAPVIDSSSKAVGPVILINLPSPIVPGRSGLFLISFKTVLPALAEAGEHPIIIHDFFPRLCYFENKEWHTDPVAPFGHPPGPLAHLNLDIKVDESYALAFGGEVINEMEQIGLVPYYEDGKVHTDITQMTTSRRLGIPDSRISHSGISSYYVRITQATAATIVVGKHLIRDRVRIDSVMIDVFYNSEFQSGWRETVAAYASELIHDIKPWLGDYPNGHMTLVAMGSNAGGRWPDYVIGIEADGLNPAALELELAMKIGESWVPQYITSDDNCLIWSGVGVGLFAAIKARQELFTEHRGDVMKVAMEGLKRPSTNGMTLAWDYLVTPSWLNVMTHVESNSYTQDVLKQYNRLYRRKYPSSRALDSLMIAGSTYYSDVVDVYNRQQLFMGTDFAIKQVDVSNNTDGSLVTMSVDILHTGRLPLEIGYVIQGDTTFQQVDIPTMYRRETKNGVHGGMSEPDAHRQSIVTYSCATPPQAIILDPHHYLPDVDRSNNYWFSLPIKHRYHAPADMFPTYYYLKYLGNR